MSVSDNMNSEAELVWFTQAFYSLRRAGVCDRLDGFQTQVRGNLQQLNRGLGAQFLLDRRLMIGDGPWIEVQGFCDLLDGAAAGNRVHRQREFFPM
jgi:hypothetical protein